MIFLVPLRVENRNHKARSEASREAEAILAETPQLAGVDDPIS